MKISATRTFLAPVRLSSAIAARAVLIARSKSRGKMTLARLHGKAPDVAHTVHYADLTRISEMKRAAAEIASQEPRIDVLINNAGAMFANRRLTDDGLECTFALNHMAYFVITEGLRERLLASAPACIVSTASGAHQGARLDFDDLQLGQSFLPLKALQHSVHARTRPPPAWHGGHRQLPASRLRRHALRRPKRRRDLALRWARQALRNSPRKGRGNNHLSRVFPQDRRDDGPIILPAGPHH